MLKVIYFHFLPAVMAWLLASGLAFAQYFVPAYESETLYAFVVSGGSDTVMSTDLSKGFAELAIAATQPFGEENESSPPARYLAGGSYRFPLGDRFRMSVSGVLSRTVAGPLSFTSVLPRFYAYLPVGGGVVIHGGMVVDYLHAGLSGGRLLRPYDAGDLLLPLPGERSSARTLGVGVGWGASRVCDDLGALRKITFNHTFRPYVGFRLETDDPATFRGVPHEFSPLFRGGHRFDVATHFLLSSRQRRLSLRTYVIAAGSGRPVLGSVVAYSMSFGKKGTGVMHNGIGFVASAGFESVTRRLNLEAGIRWHLRYSFRFFSSVYTGPLYHPMETGISGSYIL